MRLEGKNAIITGAGSGVGRASALRFAEEGAKVVCADLDVDAAKETVRLVEEAGGTAVAVAADVSKEDDVVAMHRRRSSSFGRLDIVFNNVGIPTPRLGMTLRGPHRRGLRAALRRQRRRRLLRLQARRASASRSRAAAA